MAFRHTFVFVARVLLGLVSVARAGSLELTYVPLSVESGKSYTITYSPKDDTPTTFILGKGNDGYYSTVATLATSVTGESFEWTVDASLPDATDYNMQCRQSDQASSIGSIVLTGSSAQVSQNLSVTAFSSSSSSTSASNASSTAVSTTTLSSHTAPSGLTTTTAEESSGSGGLSKGAKAGIAVGVIVAGLGPALGAFLVMSVRKKRREVPDGEARADMRTPELDGKEVQKHDTTDQIDGDTAIPPMSTLAPGDRTHPNVGPTRADSDYRGAKGLPTDRPVNEMEGSLPPILSTEEPSMLDTSRCRQ